MDVRPRIEERDLLALTAKVTKAIDLGNRHVRAAGERLKSLAGLRVRR